MSDDEARGCAHREHKDTAPCNKLCNPGHSMCPYHELLADAHTAELERRAKERKADAERKKVKAKQR
jgi:hypothetical protein